MAGLNIWKTGIGAGVGALAGVAVGAALEDDLGEWLVAIPGNEMMGATG